MNEHVTPYQSPIVFPPNPQVGDVFTIPNGKTYQWDGVVWRIVSTISPDDYVLKAGDTMTGDLFVTDPTTGTDLIRFTGSEGNHSRIRFRKDNHGLWILDANETHLRFLNYTPDGDYQGEPLALQADNKVTMVQPQTAHNPVEDDDLVRNGFFTQQLDGKVNKHGDVMTGFLETTMLQVINDRDAIIRLSGPHASFLSFRAGGLALEPHWWAGITQDVVTTSPDSFVFVRFPIPSLPASGRVALMIDYSTGDIIGENFRTQKITPTAADELASKLYVDASGMQPPGDDGYVYGHSGINWERVVSLDGGSPNGAMTGPLYLSEDPTHPTQAVTKQYVDAQMSGAAIFVGVINAPAGQLQLVDGTIIPVPPAANMPRAYGVCVVAGTINLPMNAPGQTAIPMRVGDELFSNGQIWILIAVGFSGTITADQTSLTPAVFGATNVQLALQNAETQVGARVLKTGDTMTGPLVINGQDLISRITSINDNARATLAFGAGTANHFTFYRNNGATSLSLAATDINGTTRDVFSVNRATGVLSFMINPISSTPSALNQVATKGYVDNALLFAYPQYTTGANYTIDQVVAWDGLLFRIIAAINNAPAIPNFTVLRLMGAPQGDYWRGVPTGWVTGNWIHLITFAPYGTYRVQFDALATGADESFILDIALSFGAGRIVISSYAHNSGNFLFDQFRLSIVAGNNANPVRLEAHIRTAAASPDFKIFVHGFARQNNSNTTIIQKPPNGTVANLDGTQYELLDIEIGVSGGNATPSLVAGTMQVGTGGWIRFPHANSNNRDDGRIAARVHARGLNLVGIVSEAADTRRFITIFGHLSLQTNDGIEMGSGTATSPTDLTRHLALWGGATPTAAGFGFSVTGGTLNYVVAAAANNHDFHCLDQHVARLGNTGLIIQGNRDGTARAFRSNVDNFGFQTFADGWFYKKSGTGLVIRQSSGNQQPQIENNNGTNMRDIIDTVNGDIRYVRRGESTGLPAPSNWVNLTAGNNFTATVYCRARLLLGGTFCQFECRTGIIGGNWARNFQRSLLTGVLPVEFRPTREVYFIAHYDGTPDMYDKYIWVTISIGGAMNCLPNYDVAGGGSVRIDATFTWCVL